MTTINNFNSQEYQTYLMDVLWGGARFFAIQDAPGIAWDLSEELNFGLTYVRNVPCKDLAGMVPGPFDYLSESSLKDEQDWNYAIGEDALTLTLSQRERE